MNLPISSFLIALDNIGREFCNYAVSMFVQSSVLIIFLLIVDFLLRKRIRAVFRYCIWMLVFVKLILPPTLSLPTGFGYWCSGFLSSERFTSKPISNTFAAESAKPIVPEDSAISTELPQAKPSQPLLKTAAPATTAVSIVPAISWQAIIFLIWLVGVLVFSVLLMQRMLFVRELMKQANYAKGRLLDTLNQCRRQIDICRSIELKLSSHLQSPAVCGLARPVILIPTSLLEKLPRDKLRAVLIHELAHIKRGDLLVNFAQTLLQIAYFYNPFVWLANAMVRRIREQAIDEMVLVALGTEAKSYSNTLIDIAEMTFWRTNLSLRLIGVAESKKALRRRIKHMLNRPIPKSAKIGIFGVFAIIAIGLVLLPMANAQDTSVSLFESVGDKTKELLLPHMKGVVDTTIQAWNKEDVNTLLSTFTNDGIFLNDQAEAAIGKGALHQLFVMEAGKGIKLRSFECTEQQVWICGDMIYEAGKYVVSFTAPGTRFLLSDYRKFLTIYKKQPDGSLKIKLDSWNPDSIPADGTFTSCDPRKTPMLRCPSTRQATQEDLDALFEQIRQKESKFHRMFIERDANAVAQFYADDAILIPWEGDILRGKKAVLAEICEGMEKEPLVDMTQHVLHVEGNDQMLYTVNLFTWTFKDKSSDQDVTFPGKGVHVWKRTANGWKIFIDLFNISVPVPGKG